MKTFFKIPATALAIFATFQYTTDRTFMTVLIIWLAYALLCLGLLKSNEIKQIRLNKKLTNV